VVLPKDSMSISNRLKSAKFVQFNILSARQWTRFSVCEINRPAKGADLNKNVDISNTPYDERMGALDNGKICLTCNYDNISCPGHFGHIVLVKEMFNAKFFYYCFSILKCICIFCGSPRITREQAELNGYLEFFGQERLTKFVKKCENKSKRKFCLNPECQKELYNFEINKKTNMDILYSSSTSKQACFSARDVYNSFIKVNNDTQDLLGFNNNLSDNKIFRDKKYIQDDDRYHVHQIKIEDLIYSILPVIPPRDRPWVYRDGEKFDDDITDKINSIVKINERLKDLENPNKVETTSKKKKLTEIDKKKLEAELQAHIWTMTDNTNESSKLSNGGRPLKSFVDRIEGKAGRAQANVVAKRTDFSARAVIAGGGKLIKAGWIGVSEKICKNQTKKIRVNKKNKKKVQKIVDKGFANYIIREVEKDGEYTQITINLKQATKNYTKKYEILDGDIVERQLITGDYLIDNRQPSIRIESMIGCRIVRIPDNIIRLPLCMTKPLNADFDGRIHCCQQLDAF